MGILIFANLFFASITILAHTFLDSSEGSNATIPEDMLNACAISCKGHGDPNAAPEVVIDVKVSLMSTSNCEAQYRAFSVFQEWQGPTGIAVAEGCTVQAPRCFHGPCQMLHLINMPARLVAQLPPEGRHQGPFDMVRHSSTALSVCGPNESLRQG